MHNSYQVTVQKCLNDTLLDTLKDMLISTLTFMFALMQVTHAFLCSYYKTVRTRYINVYIKSQVPLNVML